MADDILQETLMAVHKARHTYLPELSFSKWLFAIARYKIVDHHRRMAKRIDLEELDENIARDEFSGDFDTARVAELMSLLPDKQRRIVKLVKLDGLPVKEVAKLTGSSESLVKVTVHRALKRIRAHLFELDE